MSKVFSEALVLRFPVSLTAEQMGEDMKLILEASKGWNGTPVASFLVHQVSIDSRQSFFSFGHDYAEHPDFSNRIGFLPLDYAGIHAVIFHLKWASSLRIEQNFNADDTVKQKPRRFTKAQEPLPPIDPRDVPPELRFLLTEKAKEEGEDFYKMMTGYGPGMRNPQVWMREQVIEKLGDRWPSIGRADRVLGGQVSQALEIVAADADFPRWWLSLGVVFVRGRGDKLESVCRKIIEAKNATSTGPGRQGSAAIYDKAHNEIS
jgi:hypothetical protein